MQESSMTESGICRASLRSEEQINSIRDELESAAWMDQAVRSIEAVKDPTRFKIVYLLSCYERLCVCDLANVLGVSSSAISQHLRKLKDMNLVIAYRDKQTLFYRLKNKAFVSFIDLIVTGMQENARVEVSA